ncbi:MAG: hypothetical protein QF858_01705 [Candidatus Pacebacteria bacterium]|jgi:hypothetical protein|nr:hypothetical protein [Candidatus Paceibacterota bacterium]MDP6659841.1 hypothetical protein [Candidatus Paceibacterota bacterium]
MFQIILFGVSLTLLIAFFSIKLFEVRGGRVLFEEKRKELDKRVLNEFERRKIKVPQIELDGVLHFIHDVLHNVAVGVHGSVRVAERHTARAVNSIKGRRDNIKRNSTSSEFLKNVGDYKNKLKRPEHK